MCRISGEISNELKSRKEGTTGDTLLRKKIAIQNLQNSFCLHRETLPFKSCLGAKKKIRMIQVRNLIIKKNHNVLLIKTFPSASFFKTTRDTVWIDYKLLLRPAFFPNNIIRIRLFMLYY